MPEIAGWWLSYTYTEGSPIFGTSLSPFGQVKVMHPIYPVMEEYSVIFHAKFQTGVSQAKSVFFEALLDSAGPDFTQNSLHTMNSK